MSQQRICVLTLEVADDLDYIIDLKPIFSCLQNLYQSLARVSIIVLLCNQTNPGKAFAVENEAEDDISAQIQAEIVRLNDQVQRETTFQTDIVGNASKSTIQVQSDDAASCRSILEIAISKKKDKKNEVQN